MKTQVLLSLAGILALPAYLILLWKGYVELDTLLAPFATLVTIISLAHLASLAAVTPQRMAKMVQRYSQKHGNASFDEIVKKYEQKEASGEQEEQS